MNKKMIATLVLSSLVASAFAVNAGAAPDKQVLKDENGQVHTVVGQLGKVSGATAEERALNALDKAKGEFGFDKAAGTFKVKKSHKDENGTTHTKLDQVINGIPVFAQQMIVHETEGTVEGITSGYQALTANTDKARLNDKKAIQAALASTNTASDAAFTQAPAAELLYFPQGDQAILSYKVSFAADGETPVRYDVFVNAVDGTILNTINKVEHTAAVGTGVGVDGVTKTGLNTNLKSGTYYLEDVSKPMTGMIRTRDLRNSTFGFFIYNMTDADNHWDASTQRAGVDAHYYAGMVYDWYKNNVNRNSINDAGMSLESRVRYGSKYNNAFWDGSQMTYGDGDGVNFRAFSGALDVVAHELTHGVTEYTSGLVYQNQSGALNESWSDALGATIDSNDWLMGEDICLPGGTYTAFRSMQDPTLYGDPAHMNDYINTTDDNGGVHSNSGIPNKAFYNFATAIGSRNNAAKVWYTASRDYMTSSTNFSGARAATLQAASALYGSGSSTYTALQNAWSAVGVY
ncbi:M4 family metallopeptidase [Tumebacillus sp. DT12]|uniref:Neutral metalloproteinase n=1 Tax=Tumebacillus lacus TaxID=2995335 RepID=A0ABT3X0Z5_9BACL|nr:M4 family metallopeptidase [Tumebacillus lacus]MCX7569652.1 M4 family metallopeptidase [Tumebacillus lacus]